MARVGNTSAQLAGGPLSPLAVLNSSGELALASNTAPVPVTSAIAAVPPGGTAFHQFYTNTAAAGAGSAAVVFTPPAGAITVVTDVTISTFGTTTGDVFLFFAATADATWTAGTDVPIVVANFVPSATYSPGLSESYRTPPAASAVDHLVKYQNSAAIDVYIIVRGYTYVP